MTPKSKTPAATGASQKSLESRFCDYLNPTALQSQFLIAAHHVRPELAAMLAALAFGGDAYHG